MDPASTVIDLSDVLDYALSIFGTIVLALGGYGIKLLTAKLKLEADSEVRAYLEDALYRGVDYALQVARSKGQDVAQIEVRTQMVGEAAGFLARQVPDALKRFGITPDKLAQMIIARLPPLPPPPSEVQP
ncbi:MAG: hypothetical protein AB7P52_17715 [Alphaproteobacteria bacterium]